MFEAEKPKKWYDPDLTSEESAQELVKRGSNACLFVGGVTLLFALLAIAGVRLLQVDGSAALDALAFFGLALWMRGGSRTAAVAAVLLYVGERIFSIMNGSGFAGIVMTVVITMMLVNAVRAAFALHTFRAARGAPQPSRWPHLVGGSFVVAAVAVLGSTVAGWGAPLAPARGIVTLLLQVAPMHDAPTIGWIIITLSAVLWGAAIFAGAILVRELRNPTRSTFAGDDAV